MPAAITGQHLLDGIILRAVILARLDRVIALCALICGDDLDRKLAAKVHELAFLKGSTTLDQFLRQVVEKSPLDRSDDQKFG